MRGDSPGSASLVTKCETASRFEVPERGENATRNAAVPHCAHFQLETSGFTRASRASSKVRHIQSAKSAAAVGGSRGTRNPALADRLRRRDGPREPEGRARNQQWLRALLLWGRVTPSGTPGGRH